MGARRVAISVVMLCASLLGSSATAGAAVASRSNPTPRGYHLKTVKAAGFQMAIPTGWLTLDPTSKKLSAQIDRVAAANPKLRSALDEFSSLAPSIQFFAVDQTSTSGSTANVIALTLPIAKSELSDPQAIKAALEAQLGGAAVDVRTTKVAGARSLIGRATVHLSNANGTPIVAHATLYLVPSRDGVLFLDFTTPDESTASKNTVSTMVRTLKLLH